MLREIPQERSKRYCAVTGLEYSRKRNVNNSGRASVEAVAILNTLLFQSLAACSDNKDSAA